MAPLLSISHILVPVVNNRTHYLINRISIKLRIHVGRFKKGQEGEISNVLTGHSNSLHPHIQPSCNFYIEGYIENQGRKN